MPLEIIKNGPRSEAEMADAIATQLELGTPGGGTSVDQGKAGGGSLQIRPSYPSAADISARWKEGVTNGAQHWVEGIAKPRANFKTAALKNKDAWKASMTAAIAQDAYAKGMNNVDEDEALKIAQTVGAQGYSAGALARGDKHMRIMGKVAPLMTAAVDAVRAKPAVTDADRESRMLEMVRAARAVGKVLRGG
jgi:hypothetical protein